MHDSNRIVSDPAVLNGTPVIRGARLAVDFIVHLIDFGWLPEDILRNYEGISPEDVAACLDYRRTLI